MHTSEILKCSSKEEHINQNYPHPLLLSLSVLLHRVIADRQLKAIVSVGRLKEKRRGLREALSVQDKQFTPINYIKFTVKFGEIEVCLRNMLFISFTDTTLPFILVSSSETMIFIEVFLTNELK